MAIAGAYLFHIIILKVMNILIIGSGGREHAFAWKIKNSPLCKNLFVAPGNAGTAELAENIAVSVEDFEGIKNICLEKQIDLVLVGPEAPLVLGITDFFNTDPELQSIAIVGPEKAGARLEGSKDFSKSFMQKYKIPTAGSKTFTAETLEEGLKYLDSHSLPIVLKADGLAAGKGVIISEDKTEAKKTLEEMLVDKKFGDASSRVVIEEFLTGIELSVFVLTDGKSYKILPEAKDYKRIGEGDTGPNTGGMGAISPVPFADKAFMEKVEQTVIIPTIEGLQKENIHYNGFIFFGLINVNGDPFVIEYNARMGDPETEVVLPRVKTDLVKLLLATAKSELSTVAIEFEDKAATTVMLVAGGYPDSYEKGKVISGLDKLNEDILPFHAGTTVKEGKLVSNGGRVIALTALADSWEAALAKSLEAAEKVNWEKRYFRRDLGFDLRKYGKNVIA